MKVVETIEAVSSFSDRYRAAGLSVGLVPTLGALHAGHVSLIRAARVECERVVVSVFVNPTQFGPQEDLAAYPHTPEADVEVCRAAGVDLVFFGRSAEMYPPGAETWVEVEKTTKVLCGVSRPHHFRGVTTVVTKLLNLVLPHRAYFGQKDYQQAQVIRRTVTDLLLPTTIRICPTVREADGLALSSRNEYLTAQERSVAPRLYQAITCGRQLIQDGERKVARLLERMTDVLDPGDDLRLDYLEVRRATTLEEFPDGDLDDLAGGVVIAVAAFVGSARLIDNVLVAD